MVGADTSWIVAVLSDSSVEVKRVTQKDLDENKSDDLDDYMQLVCDSDAQWSVIDHIYIDDETVEVDAHGHVWNKQNGVVVSQ